MCLGLPYVAWLAALQRQRVMTKHGVAATDEEAMATACYPCNLLQMHALLQQQQQSLLSSRHPQQQQQQSVPLRAPRVQHMTGGHVGCLFMYAPGSCQPMHSISIKSSSCKRARHALPFYSLHAVSGLALNFLRLALCLTCTAVAAIAAAASEAPSQANSYAGPLTSAMTTSKVLRTVQHHATRSEGTVPLSKGLAAGGSMRQGVRHSNDSTCSSQASETGVVNSPMVSKQQSGALQRVFIVC
jgi:hypothetical protein